MTFKPWHSVNTLVSGCQSCFFSPWKSEIMGNCFLFWRLNFQWFSSFLYCGALYFRINMEGLDQTTTQLWEQVLLKIVASPSSAVTQKPLSPSLLKGSRDTASSRGFAYEHDCFLTATFFFWSLLSLLNVMNHHLWECNVRLSPTKSALSHDCTLIMRLLCGKHDGELNTPWTRGLKFIRLSFKMQYRTETSTSWLSLVNFRLLGYPIQRWRPPLPKRSLTV